jgi:hypothetical protein
MTNAADLASAFKLKVQITDLQRLAFMLALGLLVVIVIVTAFITLAIFNGMGLPTVAPLAANPTDAQLAIYKQQLDLVKQVSEMQLARFSQLFQLLVPTVLLPAFTLVLGFLFGKQQG